ncbi:MAG: hypothetical protein A2V88_11965 [Elusimicrobia bacterium RBG_16_66_12]|nr:MAG: hypothetical protein A2V88_11965 [Elusimicrobia bacterium RBG_16_66_12]
MSGLEWPAEKDRTNQLKHGVGFEEAVSAFRDDYALLIADPDGSGEEDRFILIGMSEKLRVLVVCHCEREAGEIIRIIAARKAMRAERSKYEEKLP